MIGWYVQLVLRMKQLRIECKIYSAIKARRKKWLDAAESLQLGVDKKLLMEGEFASRRARMSSKRRFAFIEFSVRKLNAVFYCLTCLKTQQTSCAYNVCACTI